MRLFAIALMLAGVATGARIVDDEVAALVRRIESLAEKETPWPRIATLTYAAELLEKASPEKAAAVRVRAEGLRKLQTGDAPHAMMEARGQLDDAVRRGDRQEIERSAEQFLVKVEHGPESPDDYAWFAAVRKRYDIVKGGDNPSVRAREALQELSELVRTDVDFELRDLSGGAVRLQPVPGTVTVVSFWATWCGPCVEELPVFNRTSREYEGRRVRFVGVTDEPAATVRAFLAARPVRYPVLLDAQRALFARFHIEAMPALIVVDGTGRLRFQTNRITEAELTGMLDRLAPN